MQTQTAIKTDKKAARRRNRNKRRRKLRQQRKSQTAGIQSNQRPARKKQVNTKPKKSAEEISKSWETLCLETYQRLITWQSEAELNFWKARAEWLQNENKELKEQLDMYAENSLEEANNLEKAVTEDDETNVAYLEFIAITHKHREELRQHREKQNEAKGVD